MLGGHHLTTASDKMDRLDFAVRLLLSHLRLLKVNIQLKNKICRMLTQTTPEPIPATLPNMPSLPNKKSTISSLSMPSFPMNKCTTSSFTKAKRSASFPELPQVFNRVLNGGKSSKIVDDAMGKASKILDDAMGKPSKILHDAMEFVAPLAQAKGGKGPKGTTPKKDEDHQDGSPGQSQASPHQENGNEGQIQGCKEEGPQDHPGHSNSQW